MNEQCLVTHRHGEQVKSPFMYPQIPGRLGVKVSNEILSEPGEKKEYQ